MLIYNSDVVMVEVCSTVFSKSDSTNGYLLRLGCFHLNLVVIAFSYLLIRYWS